MYELVWHYCTYTSVIICVKVMNYNIISSNTFCSLNNFFILTIALLKFSCQFIIYHYFNYHFSIQKNRFQNKN